tara:strand:+ start:987 stop:1328 length:342 start_codon:yes stop_codon:yes gene_type:complete
VKLDLILTATCLVSLAAWLGVSMTGGGGEAWDKGAYWSVALPGLYLAGGVAALLTRASVWLIALWSGIGQLAGLLMTAAGLSLWPLGMILLAVLSLPVAGAAAVTRWAQRKLS